MSTISFHLNQVSVLTKSALTKWRKFERAQSVVDGLSNQAHDSRVALENAKNRGEGGDSVEKALKLIDALSGFAEALDVVPRTWSYEDVYLPARENYARAYYQTYRG